MKTIAFRALSVLLLTNLLCGIALTGCTKYSESSFEMVEYSKIDAAERLQAYMQSDGGFSVGPDFEGAALRDTYYSSLISQMAFPEYAHVYGEKNVPIDFQKFDLSTASLQDCWYYVKLFEPYISANKGKAAQLMENPNVENALNTKDINSVFDMFYALDISIQRDLPFNNTAIRDLLAECASIMEFAKAADEPVSLDWLSAYIEVVKLAQNNELLDEKIDIPSEKIIAYLDDLGQTIRESLIDGTIDISTLNNYLFLKKEFSLDLQISTSEIEAFIKSLQGDIGEYNARAGGQGDAFSSYLCAQIITDYNLPIDLQPMKKLLIKYENTNGAFAPYLGRESTPNNSYYALLSQNLMGNESADRNIEKYLANADFESSEVLGALAYELLLKGAIDAAYASDELNAALAQLCAQSAGNMNLDHAAIERLYLLNITLDLANETVTLSAETIDEVQQMIAEVEKDASEVAQCLKNTALKKLNLEYDKKSIENIPKTIRNYIKSENMQLENLSALVHCAKACGIELTELKQEISNARETCRNDFDLYSSSQNGQMTMKSIHAGLYLESVIGE